jgi:ribosome-binding factor A
MMTRRAERVSNLIRNEISELLLEQVNDPRLSGFISVTKVSTSPDLKQAKIYISFLGDKINKNEILSGFKAATGFFRRELAKRMTLRSVPELSFEYDSSIEHGAKVLKLIDQVASDSANNEYQRNPQR